MRTPWTQTDDDFMLKHYETSDCDFIKSHLPLKTWESIKQRGHRLGLNRSRSVLSEWTPQDEQLLQEIYSTASWESLLKTFPGRRKRNIYNKAFRLGISRPKPKTRPKNGTYQKCKHCGKVMYQPPSRRNRPFCSQECNGAFVTAERDAVFFERSHSRQYSPRFNEKFKQMIRSRDGHRCAICGRFAKHVHHINYQKLDTRPDNCIVLCSSCNIRVNFNMAYWNSILTAVIKKRISLAPHKSENEGHRCGRT